MKMSPTTKRLLLAGFGLAWAAIVVLSIRLLDGRPTTNLPPPLGGGSTTVQPPVVTAAAIVDRATAEAQVQQALEAVLPLIPANCAAFNQGKSIELAGMIARQLGLHAWEEPQETLADHSGNETTSPPRITLHGDAIMAKALFSAITADQGRWCVQQVSELRSGVSITFGEIPKIEPSEYCNSRTDMSPVYLDQYGETFDPCPPEHCLGCLREAIKNVPRTADDPTPSTTRRNPKEIGPPPDAY